MAILRQTARQSEKTARFTVVLGRRRIGKTSLLMKAVEGSRFLYLFVSRNNEAVLCEQFQQQATDTLSLPVCRSVHSLMVKIFEDTREPLFGRMTSRLTLRPFTIRVQKEILKNHNEAYTPEDLLCFYMLTGVCPGMRPC